MSTVRTSNWIESSQLPPSGAQVWACYINSDGNHAQMRAEYVHARTRALIGAASGDYGMETDFDDATGTAYWPAGWYELVDNLGELTHLPVPAEAVVCWVSLPPLPHDLLQKANDKAEAHVVPASEGAADNSCRHRRVLRLPAVHKVMPGHGFLAVDGTGIVHSSEARPEYVHEPEPEKRHWRSASGMRRVAVVAPPGMPETELYVLSAGEWIADESRG